MEPFEETRRMHRNSTTVSTKQERIAALAKQSPQMGFTSLAYLMDIDWLKEAYRRTRKDGAVGVDGVTADEYEQDLEGNLQRLLDRAKSGTYRAPPVRRVHIPKGGSTTETRPIGIPTLEDKILQRAVVMLLEPIYEQDFHGLFVRLPAWTVGAPGVGVLPEPVDGLSGRLGLGSGHPEVFRQLWIMAICERFFNSGCVTACCCV